MSLKVPQHISVNLPRRGRRGALRRRCEPYPQTLHPTPQPPHPKPHIPTQEQRRGSGRALGAVLGRGAAPCRVNSAHTRQPRPDIRQSQSHIRQSRPHTRQSRPSSIDCKVARDMRWPRRCRGAGCGRALGAGLGRGAPIPARVLLPAQLTKVRQISQPMSDQSTKVRSVNQSQISQPKSDQSTKVRSVNQSQISQPKSDQSTKVRQS